MKTTIFYRTNDVIYLLLNTCIILFRYFIAINIKSKNYVMVIYDRQHSKYVSSHENVAHEKLLDSKK